MSFLSYESSYSYFYLKIGLCLNHKKIRIAISSRCWRWIIQSNTIDGRSRWNDNRFYTSTSSFGNKRIGRRYLHNPSKNKSPNWRMKGHRPIKQHRPFHIALIISRKRWLSARLNLSLVNYVNMRSRARQIFATFDANGHVRAMRHARGSRSGAKTDVIARLMHACRAGIDWILIISLRHHQCVSYTYHTQSYPVSDPAGYLTNISSLRINVTQSVVEFKPINAIDIIYLTRLI